MRNLRWAPFILLFLAMGCEGETEAFIDCSLDPKIIELGQCEGNAEDGDSLTNQNCAVSSHPHCPVGVCLSWQGTESYCTEECVDNTDCSEESQCLTYSTSLSGTEDIRYCVKLEPVTE